MTDSFDKKEVPQKTEIPKNKQKTERVLSSEDQKAAEKACDVKSNLYEQTQSSNEQALEVLDEKRLKCVKFSTTEGCYTAEGCGKRSMEELQVGQSKYVQELLDQLGEKKVFGCRFELEKYATHNNHNLVLICDDEFICDEKHPKVVALDFTKVSVYHTFQLDPVPQDDCETDEGIDESMLFVDVTSKGSDIAEVLRKYIKDEETATKYASQIKSKYEKIEDVYKMYYLPEIVEEGCVIVFKKDGGELEAINYEDYSSY